MQRCHEEQSARSKGARLSTTHAKGADTVSTFAFKSPRHDQASSPFSDVPFRAS